MQGEWKWKYSYGEAFCMNWLWELEVKFNHIIDECKENDVYCPIEQVEAVKTWAVFLRKCKHIPMERMEEELEDIAGVRDYLPVWGGYRDGCFLIQKKRYGYKEWEELSEASKQSGYRSYHLIIYYTVDTIKGPKKLQAER